MGYLMSERELKRNASLIIIASSGECADTAARRRALDLTKVVHVGPAMTFMSLKLAAVSALDISSLRFEFYWWDSEEG